MATRRTVIDGIPVMLLMPDGEVRGDVVVWMSHLGGSAEHTLPMLQRFAAAGHPAVSFDPILHGSRGSGPVGVVRLTSSTRRDTLSATAATWPSPSSSGEHDCHVPTENAQAFRQALSETHPPAAVEIRVQIHPGLNRS